MQIAFTDIGGWDHHVNEGATEGQLANVLRDFSQSIAAFWTDLGPLGEDTVIVTMSEFGRTARENGNRGTDHGHANVMFVLGGPVRGGGSTDAGRASIPRNSTKAAISRSPPTSAACWAKPSRTISAMRN